MKLLFENWRQYLKENEGEEEETPEQWYRNKQKALDLFLDEPAHAIYLAETLEMDIAITMRRVIDDSKKMIKIAIEQINAGRRKYDDEDAQEKFRANQKLGDTLAISWFKHMQQLYGLRRKWGKRSDLEAGDPSQKLFWLEEMFHEKLPHAILVGGHPLAPMVSLAGRATEEAAEWAGEPE
tara:strand:+ start:6274 stop:6816 length:543 start_codon:yes stop_codon:yes gene_type:complete